MKQDASSHIDVFTSAEAMGFGDVHFKIDFATGLRAIIAIHNTNLGPALGGCRCIHYDSTSDAVYDALRLAQGMSYKAAIAGLALGGGKAVLMRPKVIADRAAYFESFGDFVEQLGGRYITCVDSGTGVNDMDIVAHRTKHVTGTSIEHEGSGDPSPFTAHGVLRCIEAAVLHKFGKQDLANVHVAIQGAGHVGYFLAKELHGRGARLTICDVNEQAVQHLVQEFGCESIEPERIFDMECDVFSPCALGGAINHETVERLKAPIIAGAANNQLTDHAVVAALQKKGVLYAPDYVANAGGLIQVVLKDEKQSMKKINAIYDTVTSIFQRADETGEATTDIADHMAERIFNHGGGHSHSQ